MATRKLKFTCESLYTVIRSYPGLFRATLKENGIKWEDLSSDLIQDIGSVSAIGVDPQQDSILYLRSPSGALFRKTLPPPSSHGWEEIAAGSMPHYINFDPVPEEVEPFVRVQPGYVQAYHRYDIDIRYAFAGYLFAQDGVLYAQIRGDHFKAIFRDLMRSVDGGVSWRNIRSEISFDFEPSVFLLDGRGFVFVSGSGMAGKKAERVGPWALDPIDPLTLYVAQKGRDLLFRSQNSGRPWEKIRHGFSPTLDITGLAVDSLSTIYLRTDQGYFRKQEKVHPYRLEEARVVPDTLTAGEEFLLTVRRVPHAEGHEGVTGSVLAEYNGEQIALRDDGSGKDRLSGDGIYSASLPLTQDQALGFYGIPVLFEVEGQPLARSSTRASYMVVPGTSVPVYAEGLGSDWQVQSSAGDSELLSEERSHSGRFSQRLEDQVIYEYLGEPIHPFTYRLEFYAYAEAGADAGLKVNDVVLQDFGIELEAGVWTRVSIAAELLNGSPNRAASDGDWDTTFPIPALISSLHFQAQQPVYIDEVELRSPRIPPATAVEEKIERRRPEQFALEQNYPNPFNSSTAIRFALPTSAKVELAVYNLAGQRVVTLVEGLRGTGVYTVRWESRDLASGAYLYRLKAGDQVATRKLLLLK